MFWLRIILFSFANSSLDPPVFLWKPSILHNLHKCPLTARGDAPWLMNHLVRVAVKSKKKEKWVSSFPFLRTKRIQRIVSRPKHSFFFFFFFLFIYFTILYWFCHTLTWICHGCTCVPHPEPLSHLPPHPIPLGHPSAPALGTLSHAYNLDWRFSSHIIIYMFQCHSLKSSHPRPLPQSPKDCSVHLCLFCCLAYRVIVTIFLNSIYMH